MLVRCSFSEISDFLVQKISVPELLVQSARESQALFSLYKHIGYTIIDERLKCNLFFSGNLSGNLSGITLGFKTMKIKVHIVVLVYARIS